MERLTARCFRPLSRRRFNTFWPPGRNIRLRKPCTRRRRRVLGCHVRFTISTLLLTKIEANIPAGTTNTPLTSINYTPQPYVLSNHRLLSFTRFHGDRSRSARTHLNDRVGPGRSTIRPHGAPNQPQSAAARSGEGRPVRPERFRFTSTGLTQAAGPVQAQDSGERSTSVSPRSPPCAIAMSHSSQARVCVHTFGMV